MAIQLKEALRRLCAEIGWSYAVFWRAIRRRDQMQLVWEDGYCYRVPGVAAPAMSGFEAMDLLTKEKATVQSSQNGDLFAELSGLVDDRVVSLVYKVMASQVHVIGDGIVGEAALTGNHKWVVRDIVGDSGLAYKGSTDMSNQFLAGIQTIAAIPTLPHGVVQLGSTQMVTENSGFINQVRSLFAQLACVPGSSASNVTQRPLSQDVHRSVLLEIPSSVNKSGVSGSYISGFQSTGGGDVLNIQGLKVQDLAAVRRPSSSLFRLLYDNMPSNANVPLATTTRTMPFSELSQPTIHPVAKPVLYQHNQLVSGSMGAQVLFNHPEMESFERKMLQELNPRSHHQTQVLSSSFPSAERMFLEELVSTSGSQVFDKNHASFLYNSENSQMKCHGTKISRSLHNSGNLFPFDQSRSSNNSDDFQKPSSSSSNNASTLRSWCAISSGMEAHTMLNHAEYSNGNHILAGDSQLRCLTSIQETHALPSERQQIKDDNLYDLDVGSPVFVEQDSCYELQPKNKADQLSSLNPEQERKIYGSSDSIDCDTCNAPGKQNVTALDKGESLQTSNKESSVIASWNMPGDGLFDLLGFDGDFGSFHGSLDDVLSHGNNVNSHEHSTNASACITQLDREPVYDTPIEGTCDGLFSDTSPDQLLDAVVAKINSGIKQKTDDNVSCKTSLTRISSSSLNTCPVPCGRVTSSEQMQGEVLDLSNMLEKPEAAGSSFLMSACTTDKTGGFSQNDRGYKSQISLWVENGQNVNNDSVSAENCKRDEVGKLNRKRPRPGENPRPRPKDRQMIQDRFKELREIVPNGAKCSIDALLEKTIKHMLFLQSITNHAEKLKEVGEPRIMDKEGGLLLKDNFKGGATWAIEVGTQSMICPIIVEDLNPPHQMLVEMLCEERGLFLEIADLIRGLGLTILKGVMEVRDDKVWARFAVEANRDVTRMEIFLSLVRLLEPNTGSSIVAQGVRSPSMLHARHHSSIPATGSTDHLR